MIPKDLSFTHVEFSIFLLMIPIFLLLFLSIYSYRQKALNRFASNENLAKILNQRSKKIFVLKVFLFLFGWTFFILALMGPRGNGYYPNRMQNENYDQNLRLKPHDIVFMIDASTSMSVPLSNQTKTRFEFAKEIVDEIISNLQGPSVGLYAFTSVATKMSPVTLDHLFVRMMLREVKINEGGVTGTDFYTSLQSIYEKEFKKKSNKTKTLILLSDGGDTLLETLSGQEKEQLIQKVIDLFQESESIDLRIFTIGIGSKEGLLIPNITYQGNPVYTKLDETLLKPLALKSRGFYIDTTNLTTLQIAAEIKKGLSLDPQYIETQTLSPKQEMIYELFYQFPLILGMICLIFYLFFPNQIHKTLLSLLIFLSMNDQLISNEENSLKLALNYIEATQLEKAKEIFNTLLENEKDPFKKAIIQYNLGTLFLREGKTVEAIQTLQSISLRGSPPPFLTIRVKTHLAIAEYLEALRLLSSQSDLTNKEKAFYLLKSSLSHLNIAIKKKCSLNESKTNACEPEEKDLQLKQSIEMSLSPLEKTFKDSFSEDFTATLFEKKINEIEKQIELLLSSKEKNPKDLLKLMVDEQHEILYFTRHLEDVEKVETSDLLKVKNAEEKLKNLSETYLNLVYTKQRESFQMHECQKKPWNQILPLYHKGYVALLETLILLPIDLQKSVVKEEEVLKFWKEALNESEKEIPKNSSKNSEPVEKPFDHALELLQEMQESDRRQKSDQQSLQEIGERPW